MITFIIQTGDTAVIITVINKAAIIAMVDPKATFAAAIVTASSSLIRA
jgi:hypothetical protein